VLRRGALGALLLLAVACGGDGTPAADPTSAAPTTASKAPRPKKKPTPSGSATPTATPTPTPTPPPTPTGEAVGTAGALVALAPEAPPKPPGDCAAMFPDLANARCGEVKLDAGTLVWGTGRLEGRKALRLLTPVRGGYAPRYEGRDADRTWSMVKVSAYPLTGNGTDGVVVAVRTPAGGLTYDVLTWVKGGPLVLRGHRPERADGRLAPEDGGLGEYTVAPDGGFVRRWLAWDGRRFLLSPAQRVPAARVPAR
jgi:hypothetical protein